MRYTINPKLIAQKTTELSAEICHCLKDILHTEEANSVSLNVGDVVAMNDHEEIVEVLIVDINERTKGEYKSEQIRVIDRQGFFHLCERWMLCSCTGTPVVRSIVPASLKRGYERALQRLQVGKPWVDPYSASLAA
jgi:hypothetical protein